MHKAKILLPILLLAISCWLCKPLCKQSRPEVFSTNKLIRDLKPTPLIPALIEDDEASKRILCSLKALSFDYLGHGTQSIAFESQDGNYVLKLFLLERLRDKNIGHLFSPIKLIPSYRKIKKAKIASEGILRFYKTLWSYDLAFKHLADETGLISIHLFPSRVDFPICTVTDREGKSHRIDLNRTPFILQKRVTLVPDRFAQIKSKEEYQRAALALEELFEKRMRKGLYEFVGDFPLQKNYGFIGEKAVFLDPGRISFSSEIEKDPEAEIQKIKERLRNWLQNKFPLKEYL